MRGFFILVFLIFSAVTTPLLADISGTDKNGRAVILRSNGTWSYVIAGGKAASCRRYADNAVAQQRTNKRRNCRLTGRRWHDNFTNHKNWCMRVPAQTSRSETMARRDALNRCTNQAGSKAAVCDKYAKHAINVQRANKRRHCGFAGPLWHTRYSDHYSWCMRVSPGRRADYTTRRGKAMARCAPGSGGASRTFINPKWKGHIVDNCVTWATTCGGGGANNFCRLKGYKKASKWKISRPGTTYVIGSKKVCRGDFCAGYSSITCTR